MPVISLPEYLGLQEAPQQPVFNRTRQLEPDNPWARDMEVAESLTALRQQRPLSQIQAIQNQYDTIRDNAEKLRREREVAMQAEQAVSALSRMTPDDPDYENQRMQFQQQLPMAQFDPRVNSILSNNDRIYAARQQAEAQRQQEIIDREAELYGVTGMSGMNDARIREAAKDKRTAAALKAELSRKPQTSNRAEQIAKAINTMNDAISKMPQEILVDGKIVENPAIPAALKQHQRYLDEYNREMESSLFPQEQGQKEALPPPPPQQSFKDTMRGAAKPTTANAAKPSSVQPLSDEEVNQQFGAVVESGSPDEVMSIATSSSPTLGDNIRKEAIGRLQQFLKEGPRPDDTLNTFFARKESIQRAIQNADEQLAKTPIRREYQAAKNIEIKAIDDAVARMADDLGLDKQMIVNTLSPRNQNGSYKLPANIVPAKYKSIASKVDGKIFIKDLAASYVADEMRKIGELKPSKFTRISLGGKEPIGIQELEVALPPSHTKFKSSKISDELASGETVSELLDAYINSSSSASNVDLALAPTNNQSDDGIIQVRTEAEADKLAKGTRFRGPDGNIYIK